MINRGSSKCLSRIRGGDPAQKINSVNNKSLSHTRGDPNHIMKILEQKVFPAYAGDPDNHGR